MCVVSRATMCKVKLVDDFIESRQKRTKFKDEEAPAEIDMSYKMLIVLIVFFITRLKPYTPMLEAKPTATNIRANAAFNTVLITRWKTNLRIVQRRKKPGFTFVFLS